MKLLFPNMEAERARRGMTRDVVADHLGVTRRTYLNWMNGRSEIPCSAIVKLARLWGTTTDYLLGLTDYPFDFNQRKPQRNVSEANDHASFTEQAKTSQG